MKKAFLLACAILCACFSKLNAQATKGGVLQCDSLVVTCGAPTDSDYVIAIMNINNLSTNIGPLGSPVGDNWALPAINARHAVPGFPFTRRNLGQVFGIANDNIGDVYVGATNIYNQKNFWGTINSVVPATPAVGQVQNSGSVYKINASTIVEFVELPNTGQGIGNLTYDKIHDLLYITNFYDGKIYCVKGNAATLAASTFGTVAFTFDPKFDAVVDVPYTGNVPKGQIPWGIVSFGTTTANTTLYYARWVTDQCNNNAPTPNQVWSVTLDAAGNFIPASEVLVKNIPVVGAVNGTWGPANYNYSNPVADLEISGDGSSMLLAERTMCSVTSSSAHTSRLLEMKRTGSGPWNFEPLSKFTSGMGWGINATGGADYADLSLTSDIKSCKPTVLLNSDYMGTGNFGLAYGLQISPSTGGNPSNSKIIDFNNIPGTQDKVEIGDVDYKHCLDTCNKITDCNYFGPANIDSICCKAGLKRINVGGGTIASISYTVTGGTVQGMTSDCNISSPAVFTGPTATAGTLLFSPACTNMTNLYASLASNGTGPITVTWTINFTNGQSCVYTSTVKGCPPPAISKCDSINVKQCVCSSGANFFYLDINVWNQIAPASNICGVKMIAVDALGNPQPPAYWSTGSLVTPVVGTYNAPYTQVSGINVAPSGHIEFQPIHIGAGGYTGYVTIVVQHCNGDSCVYTWHPKGNPNPTDWPTLAVTRVKPKYNKMYATAFKLKQTDGNQATPEIGFVSVGIEDQRNNPEIVAITGAEQYRDDRTDAMRFKTAAHAKQNAFWELQNPLSLNQRDSSGYFNIVFGNAIPTLLRYTFYEPNGSIIKSDTMRIDTTGLSTGVFQVSRGNTDSKDFFLMDAYPNPASGLINIRYVTNEPASLQFNLTDVSGKQVLRLDEGQVPGGIHEKALDVSMLSTGTYFIQMRSLDGKLSEGMKISITK